MIPLLLPSLHEHGAQHSYRAAISNFYIGTLHRVSSCACLLVLAVCSFYYDIAIALTSNCIRFYSHQSGEYLFLIMGDPIPAEHATR